MLMPSKYAVADNPSWAGRLHIASTALKLGGGGGSMKRLLPAALLAVLVCILSVFSAAPGPGIAPAAAQDRWLDLPAPTGVSAVNGDNPGEVVISWHPVAGAAFYRIAWIAAADAAAVTKNGGDWLPAIALTNIAAAAADTAMQQHTLTRLNPGARYTFLVGSLRVQTGTPSWSVPAELNLTLGALEPDDIIQITTPVGLTVNEPGAFGGYTLWTTLGWLPRPRFVYIIDGDGQLVHRREGSTTHSKLLENGNMLEVTSWIIREFNPAGELLWKYKFEHHIHHDFLKLPNGNVLLLLNERKTRAEAIAAGANPAFVQPEGLEIDYIVEVRPIYPDDAEVVWEWSVWDHLVQDYDPSKANFGIVAEHPELVDINYNLRQGWLTDGKPASDHMLHANGLDYHPEREQILISARNFSEIWIIDHSTTTEEAAGHTGGNGGKGGDLLYRWGNPQAYRAGTFADQQLFWQHNPYWIPEGLPGAGNILIFSNGGEYAGRTLDHSAAVEITPPASGYGYDRDVGGGARYGPAGPVWTYTAANPADFSSPRLSNAQRLPNGNTLLVSGMDGVIFEVTPAGKTVWRYVNPIAWYEPIYQGDPIGVNPDFIGLGLRLQQNAIYRAYRYAPDYPGLQYYDLTPQGTLELYRDDGQ